MSKARLDERPGEAPGLVSAPELGAAAVAGRAQQPAPRRTRWVGVGRQAKKEN